MSGHSKWANIKRKKEANDKVKSNVFAKASRLITMAVIEGGGLTDPEHNVKLRFAIEKAKQDNMPKENIARAIEKGSGPDKASLAHVRFEAFGPGGASLLILGTTDNNNRTHAGVRNIIEKYGGKMGSLGSVAYLFNQTGVITFNRAENNEDDVFAFAERMDGNDIEEDEHSITVYIPYDKMHGVKEQIGTLKASEPEVIFASSSTIPLDKHDSDKLIDLIQALEDHDDIHEVFTNASFAEE
jgi:YebC/PmpR family DNA-binding regulatory protein